MVTVLTWPVIVITDVIGVGVHVDVGGGLACELELVGVDGVAVVDGDGLDEGETGMGTGT